MASDLEFRQDPGHAKRLKSSPGRKRFLVPVEKLAPAHGNAPLGGRPDRGGCIADAMAVAASKRRSKRRLGGFVFEPRQRDAASFKRFFGLQASLNAEFLQHASNVDFDGAFGQAKTIGDLFVRSAIHH